MELKETMQHFMLFFRLIYQFSFVVTLMVNWPIMGVSEDSLDSPSGFFKHLQCLQNDNSASM